AFRKTADAAFPETRLRAAFFSLKCGEPDRRCYRERRLAKNAPSVGPYRLDCGLDVVSIRVLIVRLDRRSHAKPRDCKTSAGPQLCEYIRGQSALVIKLIADFLPTTCRSADPRQPRI